MTFYRLASAPVATFLLLIGLIPAGSGQVPPPAGAFTCVGVGGNITFDPPLTDVLGAGNVTASFGWDCLGTSMSGGPITFQDGTYTGDCAAAQIKTPNWLPGGMNLWEGRLLQATGALAVVPVPPFGHFVVAVNFVAVLAPQDPCNQSATDILVTVYSLAMSCTPEPGSDGCG